MPILILVAVLILLALLFGPLVGGLLSLLVAIGAMFWGLGLLMIPLGAALLTLLGTLVWAVWWLFDRKGAMEAYRAAGPAKGR